MSEFECIVIIIIFYHTSISSSINEEANPYCSCSMRVVCIGMSYAIVAIFCGIKYKRQSNSSTYNPCFRLFKERLQPLQERFITLPGQQARTSLWIWHWFIQHIPAFSGDSTVYHSYCKPHPILHQTF